MIDVQLLDELAKPATVRLGPPLPDLSELFARLVADGWAPRSPCANPEELGLNGAGHRGDCLLPILRAGDTVYVDPDTPAQSGDLVRLRLSKRGAEAQGSTKFGPCCAGDHWLKIFVRWRGFDMLLENTGNAATATLLACESPDDVPVLHPVRNIRRGGRLLFAPPADPGLSRRSMLAALGTGLALVGCDQMAPAMLPPCRESDGANDLDGAQLAPNAATTLYTATAAGPFTTTTPSGANQTTSLGSLLTLPVITDTSFEWIITVTMEASDNEATDYGGQGHIGVYYDTHTAIPSDFYQYGPVANCSNSRKPMTVRGVFTPTGGSGTGCPVGLFVESQAVLTVNAWNMHVTAELIKR